MRATKGKHHQIRKRFALVIGVAAVGVMALGAQTGAQTQAPTPPPPTCDGKPATIVGTSGNDSLGGTPADDVIVGLGGNDTLGRDWMAARGNDVFCGGDGADQLFGGPDNDTLNGGDGIDSLHGGDGGDDTLIGGPGDDHRLYGWRGNDKLNGGQGNDAPLIGGPGKDTLNGGKGKDNCVGAEAWSSGFVRDDNDKDTAKFCEQEKLIP